MSGVVERVVVLVRAAGTGWVTWLADAVRAAGMRPALVTSPLFGDDLARITANIDGVEIVADPFSPPVVAAAARRLAGGGELVAVLSWTDSTMLAAALASQLLGLPHLPARALAIARNKYATRQVCRDAGLPTPNFALIRAADEAAEVAERVGLPAVVKPLNGTGSHLVRRVDSAEELADAYRLLADRLPAALNGMYDQDVGVAGLGGPVNAATTFLVEGCLLGPEYCMDVIVRDGRVETLGLIEKFLVDDKHFELGFVAPPLDLAPDRAKLVEAAVVDAVLAVGIDRTVAHVEVIDDRVLGPTVVEVNGGRPGGQLLGKVIGLTTGVDVGAEHFALCLGLPAPARSAPPLPIPLATLSVFGSGTGRVVAIHGLAELADLPGVIEVQTTVAPGDPLSDDYEMFPVNVLVAGFTDRADLVASHAEITDLVRIELAP